MKNKIILLAVLLPFFLTVDAQETKEQKVKTEVSEVTIFINGAQVTRQKTIYLPVGRSTLKFTDLSPYADAKSVQVKLSGNAMVLGVNYQTNAEEAIKRISAEKEKELDRRYEEITLELIRERTNKELVQEEISFLNENKKIGGANTGVSLTNLKETANYYRERLAALKNRDNELMLKIKDLELEQRLLQSETRQESDTKPTAKGEVVVEVDAKQASSVSVELAYYVKNAGWFPSYDIRATSIDKPIELFYKANIQQNTQEDWNNVKLKISSSNPTLGNVAPRLKTYLLDYHIAPPRYDVDMEDNELKGIITDANGEPLIGVSVKIRGTTIGTASDINGQFTLALPSGAREVEFSYVGFIQKILPVSRSYMNVVLEEDNHMLEEVVVMGYSATENAQFARPVSRAADLSVAREDIAMPTEMIESQTAVEFEVKIPYTIKSDNKNTIVEVDRYALPVDYEYYAVPKVSKDAFLLANISDWDQYNLLAGEANIFFENNYIGKTVIDTRELTDTLSISLGRDKNILVNRESVKENTSKKFLSSSREDARAWKIEIRNGKSQPINFTLLDQVPVSRRDEIKVEIQELSGGVLNGDSGEVKWNLKIKPSDKKTFDLRYKVKYPKDKTLYIE